MEKTMEQVERPSVALEMWRRSGALESLIPPLASASPLAFRSADELTRPRGGPKSVERRILRITAIFLDLPEREAAAALKALRFSNREVAWISGTIGIWHRVRQTLEAAARGAGAPEGADLRRLVGTIGRLRVRTLWRLLAARCAAEASAGRGNGAKQRWAPIHSLYREALRIAFRDGVPLEIADLAVDGDDLRREGVSPGPAMGRMLARLLDDVLEDPARNTRDWLLGRVRARPGNDGTEER
jgi:hypothetical protein